MHYPGKELFFGKDDLIVSKTDVKGRLTYANKVFLEIADYSEEEVIGKPHNIIRHPSMPRGIFELLWNTISAGQVLLLTRQKINYWVICDAEFQQWSGRITLPDVFQTLRLSVIKPLYDQCSLPQ